MGPMPTEFQVPTSIMSVLQTAVPMSYLQALGDVDKASSLATKVTTEEWFKSLPSDVKSYLSSQGSKIMTATGDVAPTATATSEGSSSSDSDSTSASGSASGSESAAASETSNGAVPASTGHLAAGAAGVAGMLGLIAVL